MYGRHLKALTLSATAVVLLGCMSTHTSSNAVTGANSFITPVPAEHDGVVVAESALKGDVAANNIIQEPSDCMGPSMGVMVETTTNNERYLFDDEENPCPQANIMFDGKLPVHSRAASTSVDIGFYDFDTQLDAPSHKDIDPLIVGDLSVAGDMPNDVLGMPVDGPSPERENADNIPADVAEMADAQAGQKATYETTISDWQQGEERNVLMRQARRMLEEETNRQLEAQTMQELQAKQQRIDRLMANLRAAERAALAEQRRQNELLEKLNSTRDVRDHERVASEREQQALRQQVETLQSQISDFERYSGNVHKKYAAQKKAYEEKIAELSAELKTAQAEAEAARQAAVVEAARRIAEAERLSMVAKVSQRQAMEREAARLMREADILAGRARGLPDNVQVADNSRVEAALKQMTSSKIDASEIDRVAKVLQRETTNARTLEAAQITLHEENKTLDAILEKVLADLEPQLGSWDIAWELSSQNARIPQEEWTVAVEASVNEFFQYIIERVYNLHGTSLAFKVFDKSRLIVITDSPDG